MSVHRLYSKYPPLASTHARCLPGHWSIVSSKIYCSRPHQTSMGRRFNSSTLRRSRSSSCRLLRPINCQTYITVDTILHDSQDLVVYRTEIWAVWRSQLRRKKVWRFLTQQFNCCTRAAWCAGALSCWNTKSLPDTLRIAGSSMTSL